MKKSFFLRPLALLGFAGLMYGCQQDDPITDASSIKMESQASALLEYNDKIDFEGDVTTDVNGFITGVKTQKGALVKIKGLARASNVPADEWVPQNRANIFNTTNLPDDHWDKDLSTPGYRNNANLGKVLIVQELREFETDNGQPNDNAHGEIMEIDFSSLAPGGVSVKSMHVLDVEGHEEFLSRVDFYGPSGKINPSDIMITSTVDNGVALITFPEFNGITKMVVTMDGKWNKYTNAGSGAIDNIEFSKSLPCGPCEGKVSSLTLQYTGDPTGVLSLKVKAKTGSEWKDVQVNSSTFLQTGLFTLEHVLALNLQNGFAGTLGTEVVLELTKTNTEKILTKIHTSCSQPIYQYYANGLYKTISGTSKTGGTLCEFTPVP